MSVRRPPHHTTSRAIAQTLAVYERDAHVFLTRWGKKRYERPALLGEWLTLLPGHAVLLDLGCGGGQDARYLKSLGHRVIGLDRTLSLLQFANRRLPIVPLVLGDMRDLPVREDCFDGIWAAASLIHLPKTEVVQVLTELRRRLRPGGVFAATVTYGTQSRIHTRGWMPGRYFARWRKAELTRALRRARWEIVALRAVSNRERKGRWINFIARRHAE